MSSSGKEGAGEEGDGGDLDSTMAAPREQSGGGALQGAAHLAAMAEGPEALPGGLQGAARLAAMAEGPEALPMQGVFLKENETPNGALTMEQAGSLRCYPFMNPSFFNFTSWDRDGIRSVTSFQDMVLQASHGVLAQSDNHQAGRGPTVMASDNVVKEDGSGNGGVGRPTFGDAALSVVNSANRSSTDVGGLHAPSPGCCNAGELVTGGDNSTESCTIVGLAPVAAERSAAEDDAGDTIILDCGGEARPWPSRKRFPKDAPDAAPLRLMGAIERALRNSGTRKTQFIFEPAVGMTFDCVAEAQEFYNIYSWEVGFGTKKGDKYRNTMREFRCQCQGTDKRVQYRTMKKNCPALLRLHRTDDFRWYVRFHIAEHNHPLSETYGEKLCWSSHGKIDQYTMDMIRYLRDNNVTLTKVNHIMGRMIGPVGEPPWSRNSISNLCKRIAKEQKADDVRKTLEVFRELKKQDPGFQWSVDYDAKNKIKTLMWCSGKSRSQYACFGDVVTFDTTYCTNIYKMPFGIFVGVNNHFQSTIFAGVLMTDETAESFEWVFNEFLLLMDGKRPQTILTDQCQAMGIAIERCWPGVAHLWCRWHVLRSAQSELGPLFNVGTPFYNDFHKIINDMLTIDEFEAAWAQLIKDYSQGENEFLKRTYNKRHRWAKPYNKGIFCAGMTSTQRSESANFMLKSHVPRNSSMNKFVLNYNDLLLARFKVEQEAEHKTKQSVFVHERAWPMEIHALQVYTNASYMLFRAQVDKSTRYHVRLTANASVFLVVHDKAKIKERYARAEFTVHVEDGGEFFECDCGHYSHIGILCCHAIRVMVQLGISRIPDRHIMDRWTRVARESVPEDINFYHSDSAPLKSLSYRHRLLAANASRMITDGDYDAETFEIANKHMHRAFMEIADYKKLKETSDADVYQGETDASGTDYGNGSETDGESRGNVFGAAGSSAGLSDSELLSLRAPEVKVRRGRPRINRYRPRIEMIREKMMKKSGKKVGKTANKGKKKKKCDSCGLDDHKTSECFSKSVVMAAI